MARPIAINIEILFKEYKDIFAWNYINLKGIPPWIVQHRIELDTTIPPTHQAKYQMNPNYDAIVKQNLNKLLNVAFIGLVEEASWLSPIVVILKKNDKLQICVDFQWLDVVTKKDPHPLPFIEEVFDEMVAHDVYSFFNGFSGCH